MALRCEQSIVLYGLTTNIEGSLVSFVDADIIKPTQFFLSPDSLGAMISDTADCSSPAQNPIERQI